MASSDGAKRTYLVECYSPGVDRTEVEATAERALEASAELRRDGRAVEYAGAIVIPADEVIFYVFASATPAAVSEASESAALPLARVLEGVSLRAGEAGDPWLP